MSTESVRETSPTTNEEMERMRTPKREVGFKVIENKHIRTKREQEVGQIATEHNVGKVQKSDRRMGKQ